MRKLFYMHRYSGILESQMEEVKNKCGANFVQETRRVITCTFRALQHKLKEKFQKYQLDQF